MNFRTYFPRLMAAVLVMAAVGCSKRAPEAKPAPPPAAETPKPAAKPAPAVQAPAAAKPAPKPKPVTPPPAPEPEPEPVPEVLFSLRGLTEGRLSNDQPLFVALRVEPSVESAKTVTLAPANGSWSDAIKVELSAAGAAERILLQAKRAGGTDEAKTVALGSDSVAEGTWYFSSAEINRLTPGDYQVQVKLAIPDGTGWHGTASGEAAGFTLTAAAAGATPELQARRAVTLAGEAMLAQDWPKAAQLLDARLATDPDNVDLLKTRALLCLQGDNPLAANACLNRAWARLAREKEVTHPPSDLYVLSQTVGIMMGKLAAAPTTSTLPAWSYPPEIVLAPRPGSKPSSK